MNTDFLQITPKIGEDESFIEIKNFPQYTISNYGRIFDLNSNTFLKSTSCKNGSQIVKLERKRNEYSEKWSKRFTLSRLVYEHFINEIPEGFRIYFHDSNNTNCYFKNLHVDIQHQDRYLDLTNRAFGMLTAIKKVNSKDDNKHSYWECQCSCGQKLITRTTSLIEGRTTSCGCFKVRSNKYGACEDMPKCVWSSIVTGAEVRGLPVEISSQEAHNLLSSQNFKCAYTKLEINYGNKSKNNGKWRNRTASLDRIDNNLGYIKGNIHWIHKDMNKMKMNYPMDYCLKLWKLAIQNSENTIND